MDYWMVAEPAQSSLDNGGEEKQVAVPRTDT